MVEGLFDGVFVDADTGASITGPAGGALSIVAAATSLELQGDGALDVNIAGGTGSTGCTIYNSTGALTCDGDITGPATGNVGYWSAGVDHTLNEYDIAKPNELIANALKSAGLSPKEVSK